MTNFRNLGTTTAMVTLMMAGGAFADVNASQVWGDYKSYMQGFGYAVNSTESTSGDTLTVNDLTIEMIMPEDEGTISVQYGELTFTSNNDGTVTIGMPENMPLKVTIQPTGDDPVEITVNYSQSGMSMIASGQPGDMAFDFNAASMGMALAKLVVEGETVPIGTATVMMNEIAGRAALKSGNLRSLAESGTIGTLAYDIAFKDPEGEGFMNYNGALNGLSFDVALAMPMMFDENDMAAMLRAGFAVTADFAHSGASMNFEFNERSDKMTMNSTSTSGGFNAEVNENRVQYGLSSNGLAATVTSNELPFPVSFGMAQTAFNLSMPVSKSDAEQDFSFMVNLGDFTMADMLWGIVDGAGQLPRDPATIAIDVTGKTKLFFDLMNPESMAEVNSDLPGELNALSLNALTVSAVGAKLTGAGDFTFDNTDLSTFDGLPAPTGAIDLKLSGANALMDKLVAMGLLPEDQAMGARMMMGMFAVSAGEDVLTSKIEVTGDGHISANGQRLK